MSRTVAVVPHSHWDREWYAPFDAYRMRLISMLDGLLDLLESSDSGFEHFHLDGQFAVVDDYLEARPEAIDRMRKLISSGRLAVGPWYVLMDEFCVSGETIVRNLQRGLEGAASMGEGAFVGYLPDMFGHVAQMPQILRQAGIGHAVVWRGVPAAITSRAFWWEAPDGCRVRAEYLPVGYAAGAFLPKNAPDLLRRLKAHEQEIGAWIGAEGDLLLMNGGDHQPAQPWLPGVLQEANRAQDHLHFEQATLSGFLGAQPTEGLPSWAGELRSGARAPLLMGVLSNRVDVKQAAAAAEESIERGAEPLATLWLPPEMWPAELLDRAWLEMIRNSAHDSICACSADPVVRAVRHRYDRVMAVTGEITSSALAIAGVATASAGIVLVNSRPAGRGGVVELSLHGTEPPTGAQQLACEVEAVEARHGLGRDLATLLGQLAADGWLGPTGRPVGAEISDQGPLVVTLHHDPARPADPTTAPVMAEAWARAGASRDEPLTVRVRRAANQRVAVRVDHVPGWGWAMWAPAPTSQPDVALHEEPAAITMSNGLVAVTVDRGDGTFSLDGLAGQNLIVEEGDEGDTYNFSPQPGRCPITIPTSVDIEVREAGPVRAVVRVERTYPWEPSTVVVSDMELSAGEPAVRITTSFDHHSRDHRIRAVFPLGPAVHSTEAECAFATVVRSGAEGGPHEPALATYPSRRFVTAGPLTVTHQGLLEHELVDGGTALAVTLLRATGILSRPAPAARPNVAGPPVALRDAQMPGPQTFRYAVARDCPDPWALADATWTPLVAVPAGGHGHLPDAGRRLVVEGARVSALHRRSGAIEVRVFNPTGEPAAVRIPGHTGTLVDLRSRPLERWEGSFVLGPWAFATARLDASTLD
jgi:mannosylglycerate hydrolase